MTSPVSTDTKHFHSGMSGAPVCNGIAGSALAVIAACLETGFDVKAATSLSVSGGVATLSFTGVHSSALESVILVSGVTGALTALNGEQRVTALGSGQVKFATGAADGSAAGAITFKMAPAGWLKAFSATNMSVYQSADPQSAKHFLRIDDTNATFCRVVGYETMLDASTGSGPFPSAAQMPGGGYWPKSGTADATARPWVLIATGRKFYFHVCPYGYGGATFGFGDDLATRPGGDPYACSLASSFDPTVQNMWNGALDTPSSQNVAMPRGFTGLGSSVLHAAYPYTGSSAAVSGADPTLGDFPSEVDGSLRPSSRFLAVPGRAPRCDLPGFYSVAQSKAFATFKRGDPPVSGTGALTGRKLLVLNPGRDFSSAATEVNTGVSLVDITGPWG